MMNTEENDNSIKINLKANIVNNKDFCIKSAAEFIFEMANGKII